VSRLHGAVSRKLFQVLYPGRPQAEVPVRHVTNGVHVPTWDSKAVNRLLGRLHREGHWTRHLEDAMDAVGELPAPEVWDFRGEARHALVEYVRRRLRRQLLIRDAAPEDCERARHVLDPNTITFGFARRFAAYKRPTMLLHDAERLARILRNPKQPAQLIVAGKAHPNDGHGKAMVQAVARFAARDDVRDHVVFLEDYDMVLGQHLAGGVDVWLNAPRRPNEACGTSGMKMLVNGGLNLSILDGWWDEAYTPEVGWAFGGGIDSVADERDGIEAEELYQMMEHTVIPEFYDRDENGIPHRWAERVRASMARLTHPFSSDRMIRDYVEQAYLPAVESYRRRRADDAALARELEEWRQAVRLNWRGLRFVQVRVDEGPGEWRFDVHVYLGDLSPELVRVELYSEPRDPDEGPCIVPLERVGDLAGAYNGHRYEGPAPADRPPEHYTPRIVPHHAEAFLPLEASEIFWS
jgi:starch phosphorylase